MIATDNSDKDKKPLFGKESGKIIAAGGGTNDDMVSIVFDLIMASLFDFPLSRSSLHHLNNVCLIKFREMEDMVEL